MATAFEVPAPRSLARALLVLIAASFGVSLSAQAQEYPSRPVTVVLALAPGTGLDTVARTYGEKLAQSLGRPVVFDNKPGASGIVAVNTFKGLPASKQCRGTPWWRTRIRRDRS